MDWGAIGTIGGFVITAFAGYGVFVKMGARVDAIDDRMKEDRAKNEEQHKEFYTTRDHVTAINTTLPEMKTRLEQIEVMLQVVIDRLPERRSSK